MNCPKCQAPMEHLTVQSVDIDRCTACQGLFLNPGELKALKDAKAAAILESKSPEKRTHAPHVDLRCPVCNVAMAEKVDVDQHHIHMDTCPKCQSIFLDPGEFADLKNYTIADYVRGLFTGKKK